MTNHIPIPGLANNPQSGAVFQTDTGLDAAEAQRRADVASVALATANHNVAQLESAIEASKLRLDAERTNLSALQGQLYDARSSQAQARREQRQAFDRLDAVTPRTGGADGSEIRSLGSILPQPGGEIDRARAQAAARGVSVAGDERIAASIREGRDNYELSLKQMAARGLIAPQPEPEPEPKKEQ